ncbi:hypothetical protein CAEBREN_20270 [Caenorhabditis brenneri]|uniref:TIL domain-containing protein n=1 Tax=Caenorhabditis brenneri TaxID=135651 RepID=G0NJ07_CAEBE|nr:hypothetical protein CAEBREN_20270 [Caenorhabditis brenneri]
MVRAILLISLLVGAVSAGVVGPGAPCGGRENESFQLSKACEATCANPVQECLGDCVCNEGYVRNAQGNCVKSEDCSVVQCALNEVYTSCYQECEDKKCFPSDTDGLCGIPPECVPGCYCKRGFVRTPQGKCVKPANCPSNPCELIRCPAGTECVNGDCVPTNTGSDCSTLACLTPGGCAMVQPLVCTGPVNTPCPLVPMCVNANECWHTRCSLGYECVLQETACGSPPCTPHATCQLARI